MDVIYNSTIQKVYDSLNNGLSWNEIEITNYVDIEKKRQQNASVSDFCKLLFKIRINNTLSYISSNIRRIDREKSTMYVICHNPHPSRHARDNHDKAFVKGDDIRHVPFLKSYVIEILPPHGHAIFWDC